MVNPVSPISATAGSSATQTHSSLSIGSEAFNVWVAERQSKITAELQARAEENAARDARPTHPDHAVDPEHRHPRDHQGSASDREQTVGEDGSEPDTLSGESDNIGTVNFDDDTPFGHRVAIL
ncbi:hypothetical protein MRS76_02490 [Rhizobiaceae bacterium n13]|uniref:Uncharacterized protein n=1 Tax=Ferirhizobium litorale TaxID=2927786 RepID=A0AAE3QC79_9HYPH|nr:hypothetical protein [Fererhizobium litorale]MDI7860812.1 hypothetical protein [Fererhizobium litorale]MDI7920960.1 hypothetical protein [Fererhizobium litorale]